MRSLLTLLERRPMPDTILQRWDITPEELNDVVDQNPVFVE